jgi:8-oxo-dGTP pyrophosphatase MutT (NUDIX family)
VVYRVDNGRALFLLIRDSYGNWGFPKGHVEGQERADIAAMREVMEETGLRSLRLVGRVAAIEWFFRFRGSLVHKDCEFFLMESETSVTRPQKSEGITDCLWTDADEALSRIVYENARGVLRAAAAMVASGNTGSVAPSR